MNLIIQKEKQFRVSGDNVDTNKFLNKMIVELKLVI